MNGRVRTLASVKRGRSHEKDVASRTEESPAQTSKEVRTLIVLSLLCLDMFMKQWPSFDEMYCLPCLETDFGRILKLGNPCEPVTSQ